MCAAVTRASLWGVSVCAADNMAVCVTDSTREVSVAKIQQKQTYNKILFVSLEPVLNFVTCPLISFTTYDLKGKLTLYFLLYRVQTV